jgi:hypothetical protein
VDLVVGGSSPLGHPIRSAAFPVGRPQTRFYLSGLAFGFAVCSLFSQGRSLGLVADSNCVQLSVSGNPQPSRQAYESIVFSGWVAVCRSALGRLRTGIPRLGSHVQGRSGEPDQPGSFLTRKLFASSSTRRRWSGGPPTGWRRVRLDQMAEDIGGHVDDPWQSGVEFSRSREVIEGLPPRPVSCPGRERSSRPTLGAWNSSSACEGYPVVLGHEFGGP